MKVIDNLSDKNLYIEKTYCMKFKYINNYCRDEEYNLKGAKEDDLIICLYEDGTYKLIFTKLMEDNNGKYIDVFDYRYYLKDNEYNYILE